MPFDAPFQLGPFSVASDGRLSLAATDTTPRFRVTWRDRRVEATMAPPGPGQDAGALQLQVLVGRVPSTGLGMAESAVVARRADVFATLRALPPSLPNGWRLRLLADHRVAVLSDTHLALPTSITALLTTLTMFLLSLGPYLDLLDAAGVEASAGMANT